MIYIPKWRDRLYLKLNAFLHEGLKGITQYNRFRLVSHWCYSPDRDMIFIYSSIKNKDVIKISIIATDHEYLHRILFKEIGMNESEAWDKIYEKASFWSVKHNILDPFTDKNYKYLTVSNFSY